jgi:acyl-CoA synthetase (AMP-forming)/AMP-acid ligase II
LTEQPSFPALVAQLATTRPDAVVIHHVAPDLSESSLTWSQLHRRSSQLAGALAARGLAGGGRLGMALPSSPQLVISALAAWKLGAVPVPVRWDLPEWERERLRDVVDAAVHLDEADLDQRLDRNSEGDRAPPTGAVPRRVRDADGRAVAAGPPAADDPGARADVPRQRLLDAADHAWR